MAQLKKSTARLIVQGISILGILLGFTLVLPAIGMVLGLERDNLATLGLSLVLSAVFWLLGASLIYTSYLMLRLRAFAALRFLCVLLPLLPYAMAVHWLASFLFTGERPQYIRVTGAFAVLIGFYLYVSICVPICIKLSRKLLEAAGIESRAFHGGRHQN